MSLRAVRSLSSAPGDELLSAETGIHGHDQHHVHLVDDMMQPGKRRGRIEHQPRLATRFVYEAERAVDVLGRLGMKSDVARARLREIRNDAIHRLDHQVHVDRRGNTVLAQRLADQRADREIRHIMIVHHVEMHDVRAGGKHVLHFFAQASEIGTENGRGDEVGHDISGGIGGMKTSRNYSTGIAPSVRRC